MKICSFCGESNPDSTEVCPWCGRPDKELFPEKYKSINVDDRTPPKKQEKLLLRIKNRLILRISVHFRKKDFSSLIIMLVLMLIMSLFVFIPLISQLSNLSNHPKFPTQTPTKSTYRKITITREPTATPIPARLIPFSSENLKSHLVIPPQELGDSKLIINNDSLKDAVVILKEGIYVYAVVFVKENESFTVYGIKDGTYSLFYSTGYVWNGKEFTKNVQHVSILSPLIFQNDYGIVTDWEISIPPFPEGAIEWDYEFPVY